MLLQTPTQQTFSLLEDCAEPDHVLGVLQAASTIQVRSSIAAGATTCYAVTAMIDGKPVHGYVLGDALPAVAEFERQRRVAIVFAEAPPAETPVSVPQEDKPRLPLFGDFSARDIKGRPVSLGGLTGKIILVCFWSPANENSQRELIVVSRLFGLFHRRGLDAVAISLSSNLDMMKDSVEDFGITLPTVSNDFGIAARHGVSLEAIPRTFILNGKHEILGAGIHGKELESAVKKLVEGQ